MGFRAVTLPLITALVLWQGARAARAGRVHLWVVTGALYGLSFYTYTAARFTPLALAAFAFYLLAVQGPRAFRPHLRGLGVAALAAFLVLSPLALYTLRYPQVVLGRPDQVSIWNPAIGGGNPWDTLGRHLLRTAGMFFVRGDRIWRHNVPWRPVFAPLLGAAFLLGVARALAPRPRHARAGAEVFPLLWTAVMAFPTVLAEDAPHFLRAVGMLPVLAFLPALGLDWLMGTQMDADQRGFSSFMLSSAFIRARPRPNFVGLVVGVLALGMELVGGARAYFGPYAHDPMTGYWFERGAVALGADINRFLGVGWSAAASPSTPVAGPEGRVYLDPLLWEDWPQVRFLVAAPERVRVGLDGGDAPCCEMMRMTGNLCLPEEGDRGGPVAVFLWPYGEWTRAWALLPHPAAVTVLEGPLSQHDRDTEPFVTYLAFLTTRPGPVPPPQARLSGSVEFLGATVVPKEDGSVVVRLRWRATGPVGGEYTVFLHYLRDGQTVGQGDGPPAGGRYPTSVWQPGDMVNDDHVVPGVGPPQAGRDEIAFGLWNPQTGEYLSVLDEAGNPVGTEIRISIP